MCDSDKEVEDINLGNGSVVEQGTHEELVSRNGIYHTLVKNQLNI